MFNYDSSANTDDGSCIPFILGCMDTEACNYDSTAKHSMDVLMRRRIMIVMIIV